MKKTAFFAFLALFLTPALCNAADAVREFRSSGEVSTVDPVYSQVTIMHDTIKGLAGSGTTEFYVTDAGILKDIAKGDLVDFDITDNKGDVRISKIVKTGTAPLREEGIPVGQALSDTMAGVGQVAQAVTAPIAPVSEAIGGASESAASSTDMRLKDGEVKQKLATF
jgi:Cu/Ag efflux protein CusF